MFSLRIDTVKRKPSRPKSYLSNVLKSRRRELEPRCNLSTLSVEVSKTKVTRPHTGFVVLKTLKGSTEITRRFVPLVDRVKRVLTLPRTLIPPRTSHVEDHDLRPFRIRLVLFKQWD